MSDIKTEKEIEILREGGKKLSSILNEIVMEVKAGIKTIELDQLAERLIREGGDEPAFKNYTPSGSKSAYPNTLCVSVNDEVVHGVSGERVLKVGDIVGLDIGLRHGGLFVDMAVTVPVGKISKDDQNLIDITRKSLYRGIRAARIGVFIGEIGEAIESFVKPYNYGIVRILGGHGVGHKVHEEPFIPNYGNNRRGIEIKEGMVLAIEPMITFGSEELYLADDGFTYRTKDGRNSAHFEHTIAITKNGPIILTE